MLNEEQHQEIIEEVGIHKWGAGYFSIDTNGNVICSPKGTRSGSIALPEMIKWNLIGKTNLFSQIVH